jgi:hypothetical protein
VTRFDWVPCDTALLKEIVKEMLQRGIRLRRDTE